MILYQSNLVRTRNTEKMIKTLIITNIMIIIIDIISVCIVYLLFSLFSLHIIP